MKDIHTQRGLYRLVFLDWRQLNAVSMHQHCWRFDSLSERGCQETGLYGDKTVYRGKINYTKGEPTAGSYVSTFIFKSLSLFFDISS